MRDRTSPFPRPVGFKAVSKAVGALLSIDRGCCSSRASRSAVGPVLLRAPFTNNSSHISEAHDV